MLIMLARQNDCPLLENVFTTNVPLFRGHGPAGMPCTKTHATRTMSAGYPLAIKHCLFTSAQTKACDMFIKQQGSHYCTQQPPCHNAHT